MKTSRKNLILMMVLLLGICLLLTGCSNTAKKPYTPTPQTNQSNRTTTPAPNMTNTANTTQVASRSAAEANKVAGVNKATAVVTGKRIYVGLDLKANLEQSKSAAIEKTVAERVKKSESGYTVMVTSDIDTVTRLKKIAEGIAQGKPISSFTTELKDIDTRMTPKVK